MQPNKNNGFSIVELLVVLTILFVLAALIITLTLPNKKMSDLELCADRISNNLSTTILYTVENKGFTPPAGPSLGPSTTYFMGKHAYKNKETSYPINIGALYEYMDITSDKALCPAQSVFPGKQNAKGNPQHPNYVAINWNKTHYNYDKNWQNLRSGWMRQTWNQRNNHSNPREGSGVDSDNIPDTTRLIWSNLSQSEVFFADDFSTTQRITESHGDAMNIGFVSGAVAQRPYSPNEWPFDSIVNHQAPSSCIKDAWKYLEQTSAAKQADNAE